MLNFIVDRLSQKEGKWDCVGENHNLVNFGKAFGTT
jgi:hypothetical protein